MSDRYCSNWICCSDILSVVMYFIIASRSHRVSLIVIPFCLSVWMSVGHSATYSLPRLIDHNHIWSAGIYLSSDLCKPFWIPSSHTFSARGKNMQNFAYFQVNVTHRAIWLVVLVRQRMWFYWRNRLKHTLQSICRTLLDRELLKYFRKHVVVGHIKYNSLTLSCRVRCSFLGTS